MEVDENNWSFNAPQYVDFAVPQPVDDDADKWFDVNDDGEALTQEAWEEKKPIEHDEVIIEIKENCDPKPQLIKEENNVKVLKRPSNLLSPASWYKKKSGNSDKPSASNAGNAQRVLKSAPTRQSPRLTNNNTQTMKKGGSMTNLHVRRSSNEVNKKTLRKVESSSKLKRSSSLRTKPTGSTEGSAINPHMRGLSAERMFDKKLSPNQTSQKKTKLTMPTTPKFMKRKHASVGSPRVKNSEESELEKIAELQKQMVLRRKLAEESLKKLKESGAYAPVIKSRGGESTKPVDTKPQNRVKGFFSSLRDKMSSSSSTSAKNEENKRAQPKAPIYEKFESMAERIVNFQKETPDRFHTRAKDRCKGLKRLRTNSKSPQKVKLTLPQTPNLQCMRRIRPVRAPSRQEQEEKELEEMHKNQFHARPVNHKILEQTTGLKKVTKKPSTEAEGFHLSLDKRIKDRETPKTKEEDKFVFHAQPINTRIMEGVVGVKPAKEIPSTVPQSPAFALKNRVRLPVEIPDEKQEAIHFLRSRPIPHVGVPFNPKLIHKHTISAPFSFEEKTHHIVEKREAKRRKIFHEEKKAREFHAQPMPHLEEPVGIPAKQPKEITTPHPFEFEVDFRSSRRAEETSSRLEENMLENKEFKAKPVTVIYQEPFVPKKSTKPLTDVSDFELFTERRAVERESFEIHKKHREAELEGQKRRREFDEKEAEKDVLARERQETIHKANPVRTFATIKIHNSDKPLTKAESPQFSDRFKI